MTKMTKWQIFKDAMKLIFIGHKSPEYYIVQNMKRYDDTLDKNIYSETSMKQFKQRWHNIHYILKYRIVCPGLALIDLFFGHMKKSEVPDEDYNYLMKRFESAYKKAERDWFKYYLRHGRHNGESTESIDKELNACEPVLRIRSMYEWMMTVSNLDNSYKEFLNMLMLRLHCELREEFKDKLPSHLIYNGLGMDDVRYWSLYPNIRDLRRFYENDQRENVENLSNDDTNTTKHPTSQD